jgi:hypothetical protein
MNFHLTPIYQTFVRLFLSTKILSGVHPFQGIGRKERRPQADSLDFCEYVFYTLRVGLGTLVR